MAQERREVLILSFLNQVDKPVNFRIPDPKDDLTPTQILEVMQTVIESDVFGSSGGSLVSPNSAKVVETITENFDVVV